MSVSVYYNVGPNVPSRFFVCSTEAELPAAGAFVAGDTAYAADVGRFYSAPSASAWAWTSPAKTLGAAVATSGTGATALLVCKVPASAVSVGSTFRCRLVGLSSSTGTLTFKVHIGAAGTVSDAVAWMPTTSAAQAANARAGLDVLVTIRSVGAGGTAFADGVAHAGAVVLPTLVGAAATASVATNAAWFLTLSAACSVGTFTAQVASVEAL